MRERDDTITAAHDGGVTSRRVLLAQGPGWNVSDVVFRAVSPASRLEARHDHIVIAAVTQGSFRYRAGQGGATLMPGALLLGNVGEAFECYYEQASGDRCISFNYSFDYFDGAVGAMAGAEPFAFHVHRLAPTPAIVALSAAIEAEASLLDAGGLEEVALRLAGDVVSVLNGGLPADVRPSGRDERRVIDALHLIEARYSEPLSVTALAGAMRMSPYHFLRVFRTVAGVTPHQYLLRTRLRRAAVTLATTDQPIAAIAFAHGFGDLSTFIASFGRVFRLAPQAYRRAARARRFNDGRDSRGKPTTGSARRLS